MRHSWKHLPHLIPQTVQAVLRSSGNITKCQEVKIYTILIHDTRFTALYKFIYIYLLTYSHAVLQKHEHALLAARRQLTIIW